MSTNEIYRKTFRYTAIKLAYGAGIVIVSILLYLILHLLFKAFLGDESVIASILAGLLWAILTVLICWLTYSNLSFNNDVGYIVMLLLAIVEGEVPIDQDNLSRRMLKNRFKNANRFFLMKRMVLDALTDVKNGSMDGKDDLLAYLPLGYMLDCCTANTFLDENKNIFHGALDGVLVYAENQENFNKDNKKLAAVLLISSLLLMTIFGFGLGMLFHAIGITTIIGVLAGYLLGAYVKAALVDNYILIIAMERFLDAAADLDMYDGIYEKYTEDYLKIKRLARKARL